MWFHGGGGGWNGNMIFYSSNSHDLKSFASTFTKDFIQGALFGEFWDFSIMCDKWVDMTRIENFKFMNILVNIHLQWFSELRKNPSPHDCQRGVSLQEYVFSQLRPVTNFWREWYKKVMGNFFQHGAYVEEKLGG